ncbi:Isoleucyl-tRNA synthetase, cytoplasmic [Triticum urartu]|uniref:isoleucine--tRNA ligase n=1 Tax=Triticum urartu TaxID=4572 RepID=M7ZSS4_TRIUA|nr:Isoleucyl-tRNA synthetase, cytoplasmic [Triticum urartu]
MRRFGWDCHGLPVEFEIDKLLGITNRQQVLDLGIGKYNETCRGIVTKYVAEWEAVVTRTGRWIDFKADYKTMDINFMESVWWVFGQLWDKDLVYKGFKVMPYSTGCKTALSNFEAGLDYRTVPDPAVMVSFPVVGDADNAALVAWTTTPWTLPSNLALCVNANLVYTKVKDKSNGTVYIVAESRLGQLPVKAKASGKKQAPSKGSNAEAVQGGLDTESYELLAKIPGSSLVGLKYTPLFDFFLEFQDTAFRVIADNYVTDDSGTGVVHCAPAFGEDDHRVCLSAGIIEASGLVVAVDDDGHFIEKISQFKGRHVKEADKDIINAVKDKGRLVSKGSIEHSYPYCWRSGTPLIYRAVPSWFIKVEKIRDQLLECNKETYWVPDYVKEKRFHNWLEGARDWAVSRSRFWGTPLPVWISQDGEEIVVMDSIEKLERLSGVKVNDLHRHHVDDITIPSSRGPEFGVLKRVEDVFDCWFESGSMPYAYIHYPFENRELFEKNFPGNFVAEGLDQTRGWFYTLMVLSTALFGKPAFKNLICNGLVLAEDGKKMSKSKQNYPSPMEVIDEYGADALRLYLVNSPVVRAESLRFKRIGVFGVVKDVFLPWYNAYRFLVQNAKRLEVEGLTAFSPIDQASLRKSSNVLDHWIHSATESLVSFVHQEMDAYRLYTVVPYLVKYIDNLTNIYVRFNRKRLKGRTGEEDCKISLSTLYHFFTKICGKRQVNQSRAFIFAVSLPQLGRDIQVRLLALYYAICTFLQIAAMEMVVVHPDSEFLEDITGKLKEYVMEEMNVKTVTPCNDPMKYASLRAEPNFRTFCFLSVLGKRLGKDMGKVSNEVKKMTQEQILAFEQSGEISFLGHCLTLDDIKVVRQFKRPVDVSEKEIDAAGDGDVLVILDLRADQSLIEAGVAREVVNRIQKLRKTAQLEPTDLIDVYYESVDNSNTLEEILQSQDQYIRDVLGNSLVPKAAATSDMVVICEESHTVHDMSFVIYIARCMPVLAADLLSYASGNSDHVEALRVYLLSRSISRLKNEFQTGNGKITVKCIEGYPPIDLQLGKHIFLSAGDFYQANRS